MKRSTAPRSPASTGSLPSASDFGWRRIHAAVVWFVLLPVTLYRRFVSPLKRTPTCRYLPTCSEYAVEAVRERGIVVGGTLATWRILRCNPLFRGGHDPVPPIRLASLGIADEAPCPRPPSRPPAPAPGPHKHRCQEQH